MGAIARPATSVAVSAALVLAGIGAALPLGSARAGDSCVSGPGAAAPAGQHWYYRIDRATHRKCWFTHAITPLPNHAAAEPDSAPSVPAPSILAPLLGPSVATAPTPSAPTPSAPTFSAPVPMSSVPRRSGATPRVAPAVAAPPAETSAPSADTSTVPGETAAQPAPHVTVLNVKPALEPFAATQSPSQAAAPEPAAEPQVPEPPSHNASVRGDRESTPMRAATPATAPRVTNAAAHTIASADSAATAATPTLSADLLLVLAVAFGVAAAVIALSGRMTGLMRTPRLSDHPDDAWRRVIYQDDAPLLAPQEPHEPAEVAVLKRIKRSPPAQPDFPVVRPKMDRLGSRNLMGRTLSGIELESPITRPARRSTSRT